MLAETAKASKCNQRVEWQAIWHMKMDEQVTTEVNLASVIPNLRKVSNMKQYDVCNDDEVRMKCGLLP